MRRCIPDKDSVYSGRTKVDQVQRNNLRRFRVSRFPTCGLRSDQRNCPAPPASAAPAPEVEQNINQYIDLMRKDVRSQKSAIMDTVMQLDPDQAAKFWPIYRDYDAELKKLNDLRIANIKEYAKSYNNLTDAKADELIQNQSLTRSSAWSCSPSTMTA